MITQIQQQCSLTSASAAANPQTSPTRPIPSHLLHHQQRKTQHVFFIHIPLPSGKNSSWTTEYLSWGMRSSFPRFWSSLSRYAAIHLLVFWMRVRHIRMPCEIFPLFTRSYVHLRILRTKSWCFRRCGSWVKVASHQKQRRPSAPALSLNWNDYYAARSGDRAIHHPVFNIHIPHYAKSKAHALTCPEQLQQ